MYLEKKMRLILMLEKEQFSRSKSRVGKSTVFLLLAVVLAWNFNYVLSNHFPINTTRLNKGCAFSFTHVRIIRLIWQVIINLVNWDQWASRVICNTRTPSIALTSYIHLRINMHVVLRQHWNLANIPWKGVYLLSDRKVSFLKVQFITNVNKIICSTL